MDHDGLTAIGGNFRSLVAEIQDVDDQIVKLKAS